MDSLHTRIERLIVTLKNRAKETGGLAPIRADAYRWCAEQLEIALNQDINPSRDGQWDRQYGQSQQTSGMIRDLLGDDA